MIKNLNDFISIVALTLMTLYSFRFLVWSSLKSKNIDRSGDHEISKFQLIRDYADNIEE